MDVGWQVKSVFLIISFLLSAFFSGSEIALFSLDRKKIKSGLKQNRLSDRYLGNLLEFPRRLLVTVLLGNTVVNVTASIIAVSLALDFSAHSGISPNIVLTFQIIILTLLIVLFGELIPKVWASKNPLFAAKLVSIPLYWCSVLLYPVTESLTELIKYFVGKIKFDKTKIVIRTDDIEDLASLGHERGTIIEEEHGLISSIVNFRKVSVSEVMTPRVDVVYVTNDLKFEELLEIITSTGHSRIPLCQNDLDKVLGIIYSKDILPYIKNPVRRNQISLTSIARKPLFVPKTKMINDLMHEFQDKKMHLAIVVDEYGGTAGLITLEDILEEIIGEIRDEYDKEDRLVTKISDNNFIASGNLPVNDLNELMNLDLQLNNEEFETLGGFILNHAGHIPKEGYTFQLENYKFTVKEVFNKRIKKVLIEILPVE